MQNNLNKSPYVIVIGDTMIIPIRCMTCGKPIGHLWEKFQERTGKGQDPKKVLDEMGLERYCCRSLFVTHVDMIDKVGKFKK
jgi:DNA-directed RNA polymerase subunit N